MDTKLIAQVSVSERIATDMASGAQGWANWGMGITSAALGLMLLALLARFTLSRF